MTMTKPTNNMIMSMTENSSRKERVIKNITNINIDTVSNKSSTSSKLTCFVVI